MNMSLSELSAEEIQECAKQLEDVLESHAKWISRLNETIICRLPPSANDIADDACCHCKFGRWYHGEHHAILNQAPEFVEIGETHRRMHQIAAAILLKTAGGELVEKREYSSLLSHVEELRKQIYALGAGLNQEMGLVSKLADKIFEYATEGVVITDPSGRILNVNQAFACVTGYSRDEVIGKTPAILNSGRQNKPFYETMWKDLLEKGHWEDEIWNRRKNGEAYLEWLSISAIKNENTETTHYVAIFSDITQARENEQRLHQLAYHDPLTRLPNRALFQDRLQQVIAHADRHKSMAALIFLDLDRFKNINDTLGHKAGDVLLSETANRLTGCMRGSDTVARLGGDEFTVILPGINNVASVAQMAQKIIEAISIPFTLEGQDVFVTTSIGISLYPLNGKTVDTLSKTADIAMYQAKALGRNNFQFFRDSSDGGIAALFTLENHLRRALDRNELVVHYQPQVDIEAGKITGMEALLRWQHSQRGEIMPDEFIPLAEESGLIIPIGEWVLRQACIQNKAWQDAGLPPIRMAVNISALQLKQKNFAEIVAMVLDETGLDPNWLELELTESVVMQNAEEAIKQLNQLKSIGVWLSIDDFGTGYSSLSYLKRLPIDTVKIDKSFIHNVTSNEDDASISEAIIALANSLHLKVIAEGVENSDQLYFLREHHCCDAQGFFFSRPLHPEAITLLLRNGILPGFGRGLGDKTSE